MTAVENELYWEMVRTIRLLGGREDILNLLQTMNSGMPQRHSVQETLRLVKDWNDFSEKNLDSIPENELYDIEFIRTHW